MRYIASLSAKQKNNIDLLIDTMNSKGLTNPFTQAGILAVISKESEFNPQPEIGYGNTPNSRIKSIFSSTKNLSDSQLSALKKDNKAFFNFVYGKRYGNDGYSSSWSGYKESWDLPFKDGNDGWRYRGRGFNGVTFKGNYKVLEAEVGKPLVNKPELLDDPKIASEVAIDYFINRFKKGYNSTHQQHYNSSSINDFNGYVDSTLAIYHANAGFGKPMYVANSVESTGGLKKAMIRVPELLTYVLSKSVKKKSH